MCLVGKAYNLNTSPPLRLLAFIPMISKAIGMAAIVSKARKNSSPLPVGGKYGGAVGVGAATSVGSTSAVRVTVAGPGTKGVLVGTGVLVGVGTAVLVATTTVLLGTGVFVGDGVWTTLVAVGITFVGVLVGVSSTTRVRLGRGVAVSVAGGVFVGVLV